MVKKVLIVLFVLATAVIMCACNEYGDTTSNASDGIVGTSSPASRASSVSSAANESAVTSIVGNSIAQSEADMLSSAGSYINSEINQAQSAIS